ncbi:MAG TPA: D-amino-acid transaminase [Thermohalobaculum sp.]|nr:D-amino-acid transaminase [Thermohalobaculum sp.]
MSRIVYVNGDFVPEEEARVSVFDRAFLMADGVYEVTPVLEGKLCEFDGHIGRLDRSCRELHMTNPFDRDGWLELHREVVRRNELTEGLVYLQVTRGAADRDFVWPEDAEPGVVLFTQVKALEDSEKPKSGMRVISVDDLRWGRRDIKTVQLLYPSLAKMEAKRAGKDDAWLVEDGFVNEGTANNAYIITREGTIVTRQLSNDILHGITRGSVLKLAREHQMKVEERSFTIEEAKAAAEAFVTAASLFVCPVVEIDGVAIGDGKPGPKTARLREIYLENAHASAI